MWARLRSWIPRLRSRGRLERDLISEIDFHLAARTEEWIRRGLTRDEAARRARVEFGGVERYKEDWREAHGLRLLDELRSDLRYGWRMLRASPVFAVASVAILAVTIGANVAVFSVVDAVFFRRLPVDRPQELRELAWIERNNNERGEWPMSYDGSMRPAPGGDRLATSFAFPVYASMRDRTTSVADLMLFTRQDLRVSIDGREHHLPVLLVSGNFLRGLGVSPIAGHAMVPRDDALGAAATAVLTNAAAQRLFGGDPSAAVGRAITINGEPAVIVGVAAPTFEGVEPGNPIDLITPITPLLRVLEPKRDVLNDVHYWAFRVLGRLRPGIGEERARTELDTLLRQATPSDFSAGDRSRFRGLVLTPAGRGLDSLRRNYSRPLFLLMGIMAALLLIACANVAGLLLARAAARQREMGLRLALGAGRPRLMRQMLTESALLTGIGASAGIIVAVATANRLLPLLNQDENPISLAVAPSPWIAGFSIGLCAMVVLLCGLLPALRVGRTPPVPSLPRGGSRTPADASRLFAGKTLIVLQVMLSLVLLVGAALFLRTLANLRAQPLGFRADHLLLFDLDATASGYDGTRLLDFYDDALERVSAVPGVESAAFSRYGLIGGGGTRDSIRIPDAPAGRNELGVYIHNISPRYFDAMGIPLSAGRDFTSADREGRPRVAIVNQTLAARLSGGDSPLHRRISVDNQDVEIVGVSADARYSELRETVPPTAYLPFRQYAQHKMTFAARTRGEPGLVAAPVRAALERFAPSVPMYQIRTQDDQILAALRQERLFAYTASGFAALALLLACLGVHGTLAYSVAGRTTEIGVRMALGADRWSVTTMVLRESLLPVVLGAGLGLGVAAMSTQIVGSMLFGVTPHDWPTMATATAALVASALIAAWLPCRRATGVDPIAALRSE